MTLMVTMLSMWFLQHTQLLRAGKGHTCGTIHSLRARYKESRCSTTQHGTVLCGTIHERIARYMRVMQKGRAQDHRREVEPSSRNHLRRRTVRLLPRNIIDSNPPLVPRLTTLICAKSDLILGYPDNLVSPAACIYRVSCGYLYIP